MAALEVIALDTATPQLRAPGTGDTYTFPRAVELPLGTANGVLYLNGSKVVTSGSGLVFDSSGNLGLGVTPSAWGGSGRAFDITSTGSFEAIGGNSTSISYNRYFNGTNNIYKTTGPASIYAQNSSGQHIWYTAPSGTAGNAISFTQAMTLTAAGNLGIGITNPTSTLDVYGTFKYQSSAAGNGIAFLGSNNSFGRLGLASNTGSQVIDLLNAGDNRLIGVTNVAFTFWTNNTERMRLPANGGMVVGTAALATTATDGFLYVPTCAGTPTGTPTTQTGTAPIVINTTNNKLYFYSGGAWRDAGP